MNGAEVSIWISLFWGKWRGLVLRCVKTVILYWGLRLFLGPSVAVYLAWSKKEIHRYDACLEQESRKVKKKSNMLFLLLPPPSKRPAPSTVHLRKFSWLQLRPFGSVLFISIFTFWHLKPEMPFRQMSEWKMYSCNSKRARIQPESFSMFGFYSSSPVHFS